MFPASRGLVEGEREKSPATRSQGRNYGVKNFKGKKKNESKVSV